MPWPIGKKAHNRLTFEDLLPHCEKRNHVLLSFENPIITVECHCGNQYSQKYTSYKAAKNSCKECDKKRKSKKRPEHSIFMQQHGGWKNFDRSISGVLYLIEYEDRDGVHVKIGISKHSNLKRRFVGKIGLKKVFALHHATLGECFDLEQKFLKDFSEYRYSSSTTTELIHKDQLQKAILYLKENS